VRSVDAESTKAVKFALRVGATIVPLGHWKGLAGLGKIAPSGEAVAGCLPVRNVSSRCRQLGFDLVKGE